LIEHQQAVGPVVSDPSVDRVILASVGDQMQVITVLGWSYRSLRREVEAALRGVAPEQVVAVSYAVSRILGLALQHHALIVLRRV
jgi:hypothetical protein